MHVSESLIGTATKVLSAIVFCPNCKKTATKIQAKSDCSEGIEEKIVGNHDHLD